MIWRSTKAHAKFFGDMLLQQRGQRHGHYQCINKKKRSILACETESDFDKRN